MSYCGWFGLLPNPLRRRLQHEDYVLASLCQARSYSSLMKCSSSMHMDFCAFGGGFNVYLVVWHAFGPNRFNIS